MEKQEGGEKMKTSLTYSETHFGLQDFTPKDWKDCGGFEQLATDVEYWLGHELSGQEEEDLKSLYWYHTEGY
ncbi:MAG: hypothetical protein OCU18_03750 [Candidatus Syntrophoarchaeum sp.]|nr:hypothetical protein [Candidatus Syntrophoarchaeum sp.]